MTLALGMDLGASGIRAWTPELKNPIEINAAAPELDRQQQAVKLSSELRSKLAGMEFDRVSLGLSGFNSLNVNHQELAREISSIFSVSKVILTSDMVTAHFAHFENRDGIVAVVGTGTLFFGVSENKQSRMDGLGATLGDYGSAYWLGHQGLRAAARGHEMNQSGKLFEIFKSKFGEVSDWPKLFANGTLKTYEIAALSIDVNTAAAEGDELAIGLCEEAAILIAESIRTLSKKLDVSNVAISGGVMKSDLIRSKLEKLLLDHGLKVETLSMSSAQGSYQLAEQFSGDRIDFLEREKQLFRMDD